MAYVTTTIEAPPKISQVIQKTNRVLIEVKGVFPFIFFPDRIVVDENKVTIVRKLFFFSDRVFPINFTDLKNAVVTTNLFFAALEFELRGYEKNPRPVKFLPKKAALIAQQIITGLILANHQHLDLTHLSQEKVVETAINIGRHT
jgi:hypothetical protein